MISGNRVFELLHDADPALPCFQTDTFEVRVRHRIVHATYVDVVRVVEGEMLYIVVKLGSDQRLVLTDGERWWLTSLKRYFGEGQPKLYVREVTDGEAVMKLRGALAAAV